MKQLRYCAYVTFKNWMPSFGNGYGSKFKFVKPIVQESKTLREAMGIESLIDDSVESAWIEDRVNKSIVKCFRKSIN